MSFSKATNIRLYTGIPFDITGKHTVDFATAAAQSSYFNTKVTASVSNASYQREERYIRFPAIYEDIHDCNYCSFVNTSATTGARTVYAFITRMVYINENLTYVYFDVDYIQTYLFDVTVGSGYVLREHPTSDTVGSNLQPEPYVQALDEYTSIDTTNMLLDDTYYLVATVPDSGTVQTNYYNDVYSGLALRAYENTATGRNQMGMFLFQSAGVNVVSVSLIPALSLLGYTISEATHIIEPGSNVPYQTFTVSKPSTQMANGYIPKNKKLLTYPYSYFVISTNDGAVKEYRYEEFDSTVSGCLFRVYASLAPNCAVRIVPYNYKGGGMNPDAGLTMNWNNQVNFNSDTFRNWLNGTNNSYYLAQMNGLISGIINTAGAGATAMLTGNPIPVIAAIGDTALSAFSREEAYERQVSHQRAITPQSLKGSASAGNMDVALGYKNFKCWAVNPSVEDSMRIDDNLDALGYAINEYKVPNMTGRPAWNYIQAESIQFTGDVPQDCILSWQARFRNGITFWHNINQVGNYSINNQPS